APPGGADGQRRRAPRARRRARPRVTPPGGGRSRMAIAFEALAIAGAALFAAWALGGVVVGAAVPFTLLVVMPTTRRLLASAPLDDRDAGALLRRWGRLHWVRSGLGTGGLGTRLLVDAPPLAARVPTDRIP